MPDDAIQVELGGDDHPVRSSGGPGAGKAVWLIVGLGLGFALSLLFGTSTDRQPVAGENTTETTVAPVFGVGAAIPGFPDGLNLLVSPGEGRALEVLTWPHQGEPIYRSVPLGDIDLAATAHFDASGQFLAAATSTPDGLTLSSGRPNGYRVVASGITGFAWHDSAPADLAWSKFEDGELQIWVSDDAGVGELSVRAVGVGEYLMAFGDWGFAVSDGGRVNYILDPRGELVESIAGRIVASHQSGLLLVTDTVAGSLVATTDLETILDIRTAEPSIVIGAEFSPNGDRVALTGFEALTIAALGDVVEIETFPIRAGSDSISWSSDGRFVLVSAFRGVAVLDTETGEISSILDLETTRSVAVTPLGGP